MKTFLFLFTYYAEMKTNATFVPVKKSMKNACFLIVVLHESNTILHGIALMQY